MAELDNEDLEEKKGKAGVEAEEGSGINSVDVLKSPLANTSGESQSGSIATKIGSGVAEGLAKTLPGFEITGTMKDIKPLLENKEPVKEKPPGPCIVDEPVKERGREARDEYREQLLKKAAVSDAFVQGALSGLPKDMQKEYANLLGNKLGGYSDEQLAFIKKHCGLDAYSAAQTSNSINETIRGLDGKERQPRLPEDGGPQTRAEWAKEAKNALLEVGAAVSQLPKAMQAEFAKLPDNKDGSFSNEQLAFLKKNCGKDAYLAASKYNNAVEQMRGFKEMPEEGKKRTPEEWAAEAKKAVQEVNKAVSQLPEKLQGAFARMPDTKDGKYSADQMAFLKKFCGKEAYHAANRYNDALDAMRSFKLIEADNNRVPAPAEGHRGDGRNAGGGVQEGAQGAAEAARGAVAEGDRGAQTQADREQTNEGRERQNEVKPGQEEDDKLSELRKITEMQLKMVMKELAKLSKDLQKQFNMLPLFKNGVGYNDAHVDFLRQHCDKLTADNMASYINNAHYLLWRR